MDQYIRRIEVLGLHGRSDIDLEFSNDINIVHGINGAGKTTLLHALTNAVNLDLDAFCALAFHLVRLTIAHGPLIELYARSNDDPHRPSIVEFHLDGELQATWPPTRNELAHGGHSWGAHPIDVREYKAENNISVEATYFPAFRTIGEAWSFIDLDELSRSESLRRRLMPNMSRRLPAASSWTLGRRVRADFDPQTAFAREVFGGFVPLIKYPSPRDIQRALDDDIQAAINRLAFEDRTLMSSAFNDIFQSISEDIPIEERLAGIQDDRTPDELRMSIADQLSQLRDRQTEYGLPNSDSAFPTLRSHFEGLSPPLQRQDDTTTQVLRVYDRILAQRSRNLHAAFATVRKYIDAVNHFLDNKQLVTAADQQLGSRPRLLIKHENDEMTPLDVLSSGERQIAGLIYSASRLARGNVILVDEPELSLHIDWQRKIIEAMAEQLPAKQLIVCTHSSIIGAGYEDALIELVPKPTIYELEPMVLADDEWIAEESLEDFL